MEREQREKGLAHLSAAEEHFIKVCMTLMAGAVSSAIVLPSGLVFLGIAGYQYAKMEKEFRAAHKIRMDSENQATDNK